MAATAKTARQREQRELTPKIPPGAPHLRPEEKKYVKAYLETGKKGIAAQKARPDLSPTSYGNYANVISNRQNVRQAIDLALSAHGLTEHWSADKLKRLADANKAIVVDKSIAYVPDNSTQLSATQTVLKLQGHLTNSDQEQSGPTTNYNISIDHIDKVEAVLGRLTALTAPQEAPDGEV